MKGIRGDTRDTRIVMYPNVYLRMYPERACILHLNMGGGVGYVYLECILLHSVYLHVHE